MRVVFLGTGTSVGIPAIGCTCGVCLSDDPRNRRRRSSLYVTDGEVGIVVDTTPDFREQALSCRIPRVDAVLFTHSHADHVMGFDDIRRYNTMQKSVIPAYGNAETIADLKRIFNYIGQEKVPGFYRPLIDFRETRDPLQIGSIRVECLPVEHGTKATQGYQFSCAGKTFGYVPDCHRMSDEVVCKAAGVDVMALDALRRKPHAAHLSLRESVEILRRIGAGRSFITHLCHDLDHEQTLAALPPTFDVAYDGLTVEL